MNSITLFTAHLYLTYNLAIFMSITYLTIMAILAIMAIMAITACHTMALNMAKLHKCKWTVKRISKMLFHINFVKNFHRIFFKIPL